LPVLDEDLGTSTHQAFGSLLSEKFKLFVAADNISKVVEVIGRLCLTPNLVNDETQVMIREFIHDVLRLADGQQLIENAMEQLNGQRGLAASHFLTGLERFV
jgi:hypothetical protein